MTYAAICKHIAKAPQASTYFKALAKSLQIKDRILKFFSCAPT